MMRLLKKIKTLPRTIDKVKTQSVKGQFLFITEATQLHELISKGVKV